MDDFSDDDAAAQASFFETMDDIDEQESDPVQESASAGKHPPPPHQHRSTVPIHSAKRKTVERKASKSDRSSSEDDDDDDLSEDDAPFSVERDADDDDDEEESDEENESDECDTGSFQQSDADEPDKGKPPKKAKSKESKKDGKPTKKRAASNPFESVLVESHHGHAVRYGRLTNAEEGDEFYYVFSDVRHTHQGKQIKKEDSPKKVHVKIDSKALIAVPGSVCLDAYVPSKGNKKLTFPPEDQWIFELILRNIPKKKRKEAWVIDGHSHEEKTKEKTDTASNGVHQIKPAIASKSKLDEMRAKARAQAAKDKVATASRPATKKQRIEAEEGAGKPPSDASKSKVTAVAPSIDAVQAQTSFLDKDLRHQAVVIHSEFSRKMYHLYSQQAARLH